MKRDNHVRLTDKELKLLEEARSIEFGDDSVPLGRALETTCEHYLGETRRFADDFNK